MKANDQCNRCGIDRDVHDLRPAPDHAFVEPGWCPTCLKARIYTASCEHMKPTPQPAPSAPRTGQRCEHGRPIEACDPCWTKAERRAASSGDEAKVREILDRTGWFFEVPRDKAQLVGHDEVIGLLREAYAAGKADEREGCEKLLRARADVAYVITDPGAVRERKALHFAADAIARRGKEGA